MTATTQITELEAVNRILAAIHRRQLSALTGTLPADATTVRFLLEQITRDFQEEYHWFNTEKQTITSDGSGYITLASNTLLAMLEENHESHAPINQVDTVLRGDGAGAGNQLRLYNVTEGTDVWEVSTDYEVRVALQLAWDDLPPVVRRLLVAMAAIEASDSILDDPSNAKRIESRMLVPALVAYRRAEGIEGDYQMGQTPLHYQILGRTRPNII